MKPQIESLLNKAVAGVISDVPKFSVEMPGDKSHGDYSTNIALVLSKKLGKNPREVAEMVKEKIGSNKLFEKIEIAGPGFINFFVSPEIVREAMKKIDKNYGRNNARKSEKIILDYTDPNPFKEFHIGHLMSNAIGESLSRVFEFEGGKIKRVCYQGDVGMHVAKAIWGKMKDASSSWGQAYALGSAAFEEDENSRKNIIEINKKVFIKSDNKINNLYKEGKEASLKHFGEIYKKLGTEFDWLIFESQVMDDGVKVVEDGIKKGIFEKGEGGAIIFKGEKFGLHTRVFINSEGLPTYEAKDLGLALAKYKKYRYDKSVVVTANEQSDYFKVMLRAMQEALPELAEKTVHIPHGMLRLPEGKMSSRTGKVITGESLLNKLQELVLGKIKNRELSEEEKKEVAERVAVGAIKYSVLKQSIGSDIIYDFDKSISFEGDSGPYLQYSCTRAISVLEKAKNEKIKPSFKKAPQETSQLEKMMIYFPEVVEKAGKNYEPNAIVLYLTQMAGEFNSYYAKNKIVDKLDEFSPYKVALTQAFVQIMKNGLWLLGIEALNRM